jgi:hypothetical protein
MNSENRTQLHLLEPAPEVQYYQVAHYSAEGTQLWPTTSQDFDCHWFQCPALYLQLSLIGVSSVLNSATAPPCAFTNGANPAAGCPQYNIYQSLNPTTEVWCNSIPQMLSQLCIPIQDTFQSRTKAYWIYSSLMFHLAFYLPTLLPSHLSKRFIGQCCCI